MSRTVSVRVNDEELSQLDELAEEFGGRSGAFKRGLELLADEHRRRKNLREFCDWWTEHSGPPDPDGMEAMRKRHFSGR